MVHGTAMATAVIITSWLVVRSRTICRLCFVVFTSQFVVRDTAMATAAFLTSPFMVHGTAAVYGLQYSINVSLFHMLRFVLRTPSLCPCGSSFLLRTSWSVRVHSVRFCHFSLFTSCRGHFLSLSLPLIMLS